MAVLAFLYIFILYVEIENEVFEVKLFRVSVS